jgi:hypothetical protein
MNAKLKIKYECKTERKICMQNVNRKECKCHFYVTVILLYEHNFLIFQVVKLMKLLSLKHHQSIDRHLELHLKYFNVADRKKVSIQYLSRTQITPLDIWNQK